MSKANTKVAEKLIEYDAEIDAGDEDGWTPLSWVGIMGDHFRGDSVLRLLLEI
jgi:ankyrin repeat protein